MFIPRHLADGRVCCSHPKGLCPDCQKHHGVNLRAAAGKDYTPPDPYRAALAKLKETR